MKYFSNQQIGKLGVVEDGAQRNAPLSATNRISPMPHIDIGTVTTLPTGADATASMTGTDQHPLLNLGLPRGPKGETGATGPQGPRGVKGDKGSKGDKGDTGAVGSRGYQGPQGETGPQGPAGKDGKNGTNGQDGDPAGFGTPSASATGLSYGDAPTVSVTASGPDTAKEFSFTFGIPEGAPGEDYNLTQDDREEIAGIVENDIFKGLYINALNGRAYTDSSLQEYVDLEEECGSLFRVYTVEHVVPIHGEPYTEITLVDSGTLQKAVDGSNTYLYINNLCFYNYNSQYWYYVLSTGACPTFELFTSSYTESNWLDGFIYSDLDILAQIRHMYVTGKPQILFDFKHPVCDEDGVWDTKTSKVVAYASGELVGYAIDGSRYQCMRFTFSGGYTDYEPVDQEIPRSADIIGSLFIDWTTGRIWAVYGSLEELRDWCATLDATKQNVGNYAASKEGDNTYAALRASSIPWGQVDATSTSTVFTATVPGVTEYRDGVSFWLKNGIVTSATGFTIDINGLGAKKSYNNMTVGTQDTTIFNVSYTMLFVYDESLDSGAGGFYCYRGYDANTNTLGYQLRTNSSTLPASQKFYRYRLLFTSADGTHWVPANTSSSTNATASRTPNSTPIDPFGEIVYYGTTSAVNADANVSATYIWQEYTLTLGYSFNNTGAALVLPYPKPIYLVCDPQTDGSAIINSTTPYATALPTAEDGKIYIFLGRTYSETNIELTMKHPVYYYKNNAIRQWTGPV